MKMTKKETIKEYLNDMPDVDLIDLVRDINSYTGDYEPWAFIPMNEFDEYYAGASPMQIAKDVQNGGDDFCIDDDYFYYDSWGILTSSNEKDAADSIRTGCMTDLINDFMKGRYSDYVESYDYDLADIIDNTEDDAIFDNKGNEIVE